MAAGTGQRNDPGNPGTSASGIPNDWLRTLYYPTLDTAIGTAYSYMHTTVNWTISLSSAVVLFISTRTTFPDETSWVALCVAAMLVSHFASRTAKGYINVLRWAAIQRIILRGICDTIDESAASAVMVYHIKWISPVHFRTVIGKLLFELGFVYLYAGIVALLFYTAPHVKGTTPIIALTGVTVVAIVVEFVSLRFSPYLRHVDVDAETRHLR
jgi:hypothetical protein